MAIEIERKFLVSSAAWQTNCDPNGGSPTDATFYRQGYLNRDKNRTLRVRLAGTQAYLTIKGITVGASRVEFEYPIPVADAEQMLALCDGPLVEKIRHRIFYENTCWEVDAFLGANAGLVVAEVELTDEEQAFARPPWLGQEVTTDPRYYNANLAVHPYQSWPPMGEDGGKD
jgi:CYTH domain-containing protein